MQLAGVPQCVSEGTGCSHTQQPLLGQALLCLHAEKQELPCAGSHCEILLINTRILSMKDTSANLTAVPCQTAHQHLDYSFSVGLAVLWHPPGPDPKLMGFNREKKVHWSWWLWICPFAHLLWWFIQHWHAYFTSEAHRAHGFNLTISLVTGKELCWQLRHWKTLIILYIIITFYFLTEGRIYNKTHKYFVLQSLLALKGTVKYCKVQIFVCA